MKLGFIGCGNMAGAIIEGIIKSRVIAPEYINVYDINTCAAESIKEKYPIKIMNSERETVFESDVVILAVKPNVITDVLDKINTALEESDTLIISIAAGKTISYIRNNLSHDNRIIRVMPNINATVGEAMCAYTANDKANDADRQLCELIFSAVGKVLYIEEKQFPIFGVIGGCGPAFSYMFIDSLARAAVKNGMDKDTALMTAAQTVLGSAKMVLEKMRDEHPWELIDKVCSPGGTTIEGVASLQNDGFEAAVNNAVNKALEKDAKL